ncbi:hypothetical protein F2Q68_00026438 [Brassica cretica]|uniref:Uncharacterized protein n=1 Tax=Brassica cretica TaxID=69181 RepID=A0A8S9IDY1_BRACR|nr:hypothetical protein F2Q68_00026438 [Brassica cretica]
MEPKGHSSISSDRSTKKKTVASSASAKPNGKSNASSAVAMKPNGKSAVSSVILMKPNASTALSSAHDDKVMLFRDVKLCPHEVDLSLRYRARKQSQGSGRAENREADLERIARLKHAEADISSAKRQRSKAEAYWLQSLNACSVLKLTPKNEYLCVPFVSHDQTIKLQKYSLMLQPLDDSAPVLEGS